MPRPAARSRVFRTLTAGPAVVLALGLAACGSQLEPQQVATQTGAGTGTTVQGGEVVPGTDAGTTDGAALGDTGGGTTTSSGTTASGGTTAGSTAAPGGASGSSGGGGGHGSGDNAADGG